MIRTLAPAMIALALAGCGSPPPAQKTATKEPEAPAPKITSFYPAPGRITKGEAARICYGVEGAKTVTIAPAVERVWPALSRCFEVRPGETTTYKLTASDEHGRSDQKSITVEVGAAKPAGPHINEVIVSKLEITRGDLVTVCYTARNATSIRVSPGTAAAALQPDKGCVTDYPKTTTTYQVVATGAAGQTDSARVTVKVR